jgi:hypothetical protein
MLHAHCFLFITMMSVVRVDVGGRKCKKARKIGSPLWIQKKLNHRRRRTTSRGARLQILVGLPYLAYVIPNSIVDLIQVC